MRQRDVQGRDRWEVAKGETTAVGKQRHQTPTGARGATQEESSEEDDEHQRCTAAAAVGAGGDTAAGQADESPAEVFHSGASLLPVEESDEGGCSDGAAVATDRCDY